MTTKTDALATPITQVGGLAVVQVRKAAEALALPDYLKDGLGSEGSEGVTSDDLLIPRLGQAQALSPQINKNKDVFIDGLTLGQLFNTATNEVYGEEVMVIPVEFFADFIQFNPLEEGGGIVRRFNGINEVPPALLEYTDDGKGGTNKPVVTHFRNRLCLLWDGGETIGEPIVVSFKNSGKKTMAQWNVQILKKGFKAFYQVYKLSSVERSNKKFDWQGLNATFVGLLTPELLAQVKQKVEQLKGAKVQVDYKGAEAEGDAKESAEGDTSF